MDRLIGKGHDIAKAGQYRNIDRASHAECFLKFLEGRMILLCQRLVDVNGLEPTASVMDGDRDVDTSAETALLDDFSNLLLQLYERPGNSDGDFQEAVVYGTDLYGDTAL